MSNYIPSLGVLAFLVVFYTLTMRLQTNSIDKVSKALSLFYRLGGFQESTEQDRLALVRAGFTDLKSNHERDLLKIIHPDTVLGDFYVYRHQAFNDTVRREIRQSHFDSQPFHEVFQSSLVSNYRNKTASNVASQFGVLEMQMHFPTPDLLNNKIELAKAMNSRLDVLTLGDASSDCLHYALFQKKSFALDIPNQCKDFFTIANKLYNYSSPNETYAFVKKTNQHNQEGTELAFKAVMKQIQVQFDYGAKCNKPPASLIMQEYISNPLLIKNFHNDGQGRKFDIRIHIVVVSTNPVILYVYKNFYFMKCVYKFDHNTFKNQSHICSAGYQKNYYSLLERQNNSQGIFQNDLLPYDQITESVTFEKFADYLIEEKKIKNRKWIKSDMIPEMEKKLTHYIETFNLKNGELIDPRYGEWKACEFDVDSDLNFWLLECTPQPNSIAKAGTVMEEFQMKMAEQGLQIVRAYQRAKFLRIKKVIEEIRKMQSKYTKKWPQKLINQLKNQIAISLQDQIIKDKSLTQHFHLVDYAKTKNQCQKYVESGLQQINLGNTIQKFRAFQDAKQKKQNQETNQSEKMINLEKSNPDLNQQEEKSVEEIFFEEQLQDLIIDKQQSLNADLLKQDEKIAVE